jgi:AraC-like DNA-binding protein
LPVSIVYIYLIPFLALPAEEKVQVYRNQGAGYEVFNAIRNYAIEFLGIIYVIWSSLLLRRHRRRIQNQFSYLEKINLQWLQFLIWGLSAIWVLVIVIQKDIFIFAGAVVFVFLIAFFGIRQAAIFTNGRIIYGDEEQKEKYSKSGLTEEMSEKLYQELISLMNEEGVYRKNDLSISELASRLEVHPNYLSQIINEKEGKNFYDFVNDYRIEEFKRIIADPKNQQISISPYCPWPMIAGSIQNRPSTGISRRRQAGLPQNILPCFPKDSRVLRSAIL